MGFKYNPPLDDALFRPIYLDKIDPGFSDVEEFECSVYEVFKKMKEFEIDLIYVRVETPRIRKYVKSTSRSSAPTSGGRDVYRCRHYAKDSGVHEKALGVGERSKIHCSASFTIFYPYGYKHDDVPGLGKKMNLRDHGDAIVRVSWRSKHTHQFNSEKEFASATLSREAYNSLLSLVSIGFTWKKIEKIQAREFAKGHMFQQEISKVNADTMRNMVRKAQFPHSMQGKKIGENLDTMIASVRWSGGFAELTEEFYSLDEPRMKLQNYQTNAQNNIFSLVFMTAWQKQLLKRNEKIFSLDATHKTSTGIYTGEDVCLFTLYVKNQTTGQAAPAAFMLTNGERAPVIADFLEKIKRFSQFEPSHAVISYSQAQKTAIEHVWSGSLPFVYRRFDVKRAFRRRVSEKISSADKTAVAEATRAFYDIVDCKSMPEADAKIEDFLSKFREHSDLIEYMQTEWFSQKHLVVDGSYETFMEGTSTVESFHSVLNRKILQDARRIRIDLWSHKLLDEVLVFYMGKERRSELVLQERVHNSAEQTALQQVSELRKESLMGMATRIGSGQFVVKSFSDLYKTYTVSYRLAGSNIDSCECTTFVSIGSWCKHLFLVDKWWEIYLVIHGDVTDTDIGIQGRGFESGPNSTRHNATRVDDTHATTTITPSNSTDSRATPEASSNETRTLDGPEIVPGNGLADKQPRGNDVRITTNSHLGNVAPELIDINRQDLMTSDIVHTKKRSDREVVDQNWEEAVKRACRFRNSINRDDQYIAFSNKLISSLDTYIKEFEGPGGR